MHEINIGGKIFSVDENKFDFIKRVLYCTEPLAMKLWSIEDVKQMYEEVNERKPTEEELARAVNNLDIDVLEVCTDAEWGAIEDAVRE